MCTLYIQLPLGVVGNVLVGAVGAELQLQLQSCDGEAVVGGGLVNSIHGCSQAKAHAWSSLEVPAYSSKHTTSPLDLSQIRLTGG